MERENKMTYELAKKLKDAEYSQDKKSGIYLHKSGPLNLGKIRIKDFSEVSEGMVYMPTLQELIEACGDDFPSLSKDYINGGWMCNEPLDGDTGEITRGDTPEEAVANFWLTLNEKK